MRMLLLRLLAFIALSLVALPALAQSPNTDTYFYTPGGCGVNGALGMCLNGSNKAVPCSSTGVVPGPTTITDGTNGPVTVKPPSTPATNADKALVVELRPDSPGIGVDPCSYANKLSKPINITSAATTSLVAVSGATTVYVCGFSVTISQVVTTPNTILFEYGTGAACTSPTALTGIYGGGGVTAAAPITVSYGTGGSTIFASAASNGICALTAIGASGSFQGVLTYVQQ